MTMPSMKEQAEDILRGNILPFWMNRMRDDTYGGFLGEIDGEDRVVERARKGAILNARILWAFSAAYRVLGDDGYLTAAERAKDYIIAHFLDKEYGGVYWSVDYQGRPLDTKKQSYAIGFTIYGMSEYARATGDKEALDIAVALYRDLESHAFDSENNGYTEALTREWQPMGDMRLSDKDENASKTMNTHLHIIEPYTNLYRIWRDEGLKRQIVNLLDIFLNKILNGDTFHLDLFFDDRWQGRRDTESYGHDIEASWLLHETALVLGDKTIIDRIVPVIIKIAGAADEGLRDDGAMVYERWKGSGVIDEQRQWWVQCECVIGHVNLYQYFGMEKALESAARCLGFIREKLIDHDNGEWHWGVNADGTVNRKDDKAGFWKCPYHNTRMCTEIMEREV